ncbi:MAG: NAD(P)/FAD-dependent oxidoreductase [Rhodobacteraceae bacterium]|jgi:predicted Rossmann fold flavoprotein|nr:NAD(P)/FAD-dependent oxidoreductase [Paracoccaceae bacterium]
MEFDTVIIGAGAAGLMCAPHAAGPAGRRVLVIDHAKAPGEKIRISGGGRCNFTNMHCDPQAFLGANPHFCKSALARYTQWDFLDLVQSHKIAWHEKTLGQLFCDDKATQIVAMLQAEMHKAGAELWLQTALRGLTHDGQRYRLQLERQGQHHNVTARALVVAAGGKSIPKMGATGLAYEIATQFGHTLTQTRPALVPFTFSDTPFAAISGTATPARASAGGASFDEAVLFTHRGLSGPAILQISSYWREGCTITLDLDPEGTLLAALRAERQAAGRKHLSNALSQHLPARLVQHLAQKLPADLGLATNLADHSDARLAQVVEALRNWQLKPTATEGYRTAEVTLGGVDTGQISSKTMESTRSPGLYFIGECVDVTGWLGGYNFQWAWSSAVAAGRAIAARAQA